MCCNSTQKYMNLEPVIDMNKRSQTLIGNLSVNRRKTNCPFGVGVNEIGAMPKKLHNFHNYQTLRTTSAIHFTEHPLQFSVRMG